ncbi:hypothetical protein JCM8208_004506 [Rhodotorula glutinis]
MSNTTGTSSQGIGADAGQRGKEFASLDHPASSSSSSSTSTFAPPPPPPRHPPTSTPTPAPAFADPSQTPTAASHASSSSASAGASLGGRVRGVFEAIHGAGEALRGNINAAVDGLGDGIANRPQGTVESRQSASGEQSVAQKGLEELKGGISAARGEPSASSTTTTGRTI